jgi:probable DNA metabolism protein
MRIFRYDQTLEGLLTAMFDAYSRRTFPDRLIGPNDILPMFAAETHSVVTSREKAGRVWTALEKKITKGGCDQLIHVWLSELEEAPELIARYMRKAFDAPHPVATDFTDPDVLRINKIARKVSSERLHVMQFVRFQQTADNIYFAPASPQYNVLPLTLAYFKDRFSFQQWMVYDLGRSYGYYYNMKETTEVTLDAADALSSGRLSDSILADNEKQIQNMWSDYIKALSIKERINPKLQRQHMPQRFWKYMPDKNWTNE